MKKLFLIPILLASLFLCACQSPDTEDYTSQLRLNISHIDENDEEKEIHISYPVFGGIENKEAVTIINTSISNFVNSQYDEFQKALTTTEQEVLSDPSKTLDPSADNTDIAAEDQTDNKNNTGTDNKDGENRNKSDNSSASDNTENSKKSGVKTKNSKAITLSMTFKITYNKNNYICIVQTYEKNLGKDKKFNGQRSFFSVLKTPPTYR